MSEHSTIFNRLSDRLRKCMKRILNWKKKMYLITIHEGNATFSKVILQYQRLLLPPLLPPHRWTPSFKGNKLAELLEGSLLPNIPREPNFRRILPGDKTSDQVLADAISPSDKLEASQSSVRLQTHLGPGSLKIKERSYSSCLSWEVLVFLKIR